MSRVFFALFAVLLRAGADAFCVPSHMCARVAGHRNAAPEMFDAAHAVDMAKVGFALGAGMTQYVKSQESMRAKLRAEEMYLQQPNRRQYVEQKLERCFARRPSPRRRRVRGAGPKMIDSDIILGAGLLFGGTAMGAGVIAFVENQGQRTNDRGGMSDETAGSFEETTSSIPPEPLLPLLPPPLLLLEQSSMLFLVEPEGLMLLSAELLS